MSSKIDYDTCNGCKECYDVCPLDIIAWDEEKDMPYVAYPDECQLCFLCQEECPEEAIAVKIPIVFW